jgi:hypothetical protein
MKNIKWIMIAILILIAIAALVNMNVGSNITNNTVETDEPAAAISAKKSGADKALDDKLNVVDFIETSPDLDSEPISASTNKTPSPVETAGTLTQTNTEQSSSGSDPGAGNDIIKTNGNGDSVTTPPEPVQPPAAAPQKYSIVGPDGLTYTSYQPIFIVCTCTAKFSSAAEWQAHHDYYAAFRCNCGQHFDTISGWEAHTGIYDPATYLYTGKNYEQAAAEGHGLTNEATHSAETTRHGGWYTS